MEEYKISDLDPDYFSGVLGSQIQNKSWGCIYNYFFFIVKLRERKNQVPYRNCLLIKREVL